MKLDSSSSLYDEIVPRCCQLSCDNGYFLASEQLSDTSSEEGSCACNGSNYREAKLSANNRGIISAPEIITNCSPNIGLANFYTSFAWNSTTNQPNISSSTSLASGSSIFSMYTVVSGKMSTVKKSTLCASALDIVHQNGTSSLAKEGE